MIIQHRTDFHVLSSCLLDSKSNIDIKIEKLSEIEDKQIDSIGKIQFLLDWICSTIDFLSKSDKLIATNIQSIKALLSLLCGYLSKSVILKLQCLLKLNVLEVLTKFCKEEALFGADLIVCVWHDVLHYQIWKQSLPLKLNSLVEVLSYMADQMLKVQNLEKCVFVIFSLLSHYNKQIKSQYNLKKLFLHFCEKLLLKVLWVRCLLHDQNDVLSAKVCTTVDEILKNVILQRDHMNSLKLYLNYKLNVVDNEPAAKMKKTENDIYFKMFFEKLDSCETKLQCFLLKMVPTLYKMLIVTVRKPSSTANLACHETFELLRHFNSLCQLKNNMLNENRSLSLKCLEELLKVVADYDVYQRAEDTSKGSQFFNWMVDMLYSAIGCYLNSKDDDQISILHTISLFLKINHLVVEGFLGQIWVICLEKKSISVTKEADILLCDLLTVYHKLHQLDKLMMTFNIGSEFENGIMLQDSFIEKYSATISELEVLQACALSEIFLTKLKQVSKETSEADCFILENEAFLLCYLVLTNASVIPINGYMKPALQTFIDMLDTLSTEANRIHTLPIKKKESKMRILNTSLLVSYSVLSVQFLLQQYSLCDMKMEMRLIDDIKDNDTAVQKYLKACLSILMSDNGNGTCNPINLESLFNSYLSDKQFNFSNLFGDFSKFNILKMTEESLWYYLFQLIEDNFFVFTNTPIINKYTNIAWKIHYRHDKSDEGTSLYMLECYNSIEFQSSLVHSIKTTFNEIVPFKFVNEESLKQTKLSEKVDHMNDILTLLQGVISLPLVYFTEPNLYTLSCMILHVLKQFETTPQINKACLDCLRIIAESILSQSYNKSSVIFHEILKCGFNFAMSISDAENNIWVNEEAFFKTLFSAIIKYSMKDATLNADLVRSICSHVDALNPKALGIVDSLFQLMASLLADPLITSRSEHATYLLLTEVGKHVVEYINKTDFEYKSSSLFVSLCKCIQIAQQKRGEKSLLKDLEDDLVDLFFRNSCKLIKKLELNEIELQIQQLELLQLLYLSPLEFTLRLRSTIQSDESLLVSNLLCSKFEDPILNGDSIKLYIEKRNSLVASIVLMANEQKMLALLTMLSDALVKSLQNDDWDVVLIWVIILNSKWKKAHKVVLWNVMPKVIMASVHLLSHAKRSEQVVSSLKQLIAIVNITKNSLMSQYITCIFHVFPVLHSVIKLLSNDRFTEIFGLMYELASQLLFNHQTAISSTVHSFLNCANDMLQNLMSYTNIDGHYDEDVMRCCEQIARLYREIGSHKSLICKYSPYLIADYVRYVQSGTLNAKMKTCLDDGIFCILDTCTEYEFSLLNVSLEKSEKEQFMVIRRNFEKHHKYQGKA